MLSLKKMKRGKKWVFVEGKAGSLKKMGKGKMKTTYKMGSWKKMERDKVGNC